MAVSRFCIRFIRNRRAESEKTLHATWTTLFYTLPKDAETSLVLHNLEKPRSAVPIFTMQAEIFSKLPY